MKILILQLARFGDIYSTWPAFNALKRKYPTSEVHLLVRSRFQDATIGLFSVDRVHTLETAKILEPCIELSNVQEALTHLGNFVGSLRSEKFDKIINLSFSPFSSYLTSLLTEETTSVVGYHRHSDGHLALTDTWSSYFYAQVGVEKPNRIHLADIFSQMVGADLQESDWTAPPISEFAFTEKVIEKYVVVHLGASQKNKTYSTDQWLSALGEILNHWNGSMVLVGSADEQKISKEIENKFEKRIISLVGKTKISDLFSIIKHAELLIGADSAPIHIASLVGCVTLNLSCASVNLWETGPRAPGSRILYSDVLIDLDPQTVAAEALSILCGERPLKVNFYTSSARQILALHDKATSKEWSLIEFLYFEGPVPITTDLNFATALVNMYDVTQLAIEQLYNLQRNPQDLIARAVLQRTDNIIADLSRLVPSVIVLVRWFQTEKIQIGPSGFNTILEKTFRCYKKLGDVLTQLQANVNLTAYQGGQNGKFELESR